MFFLSFRSEVETRPYLKERLLRGLPVVLPVTIIDDKRLIPYRIEDWSQLKKGAFGILEPDPSLAIRVNPALIDCVIVPGSVFDRTGNRHGYGGGFYDRFLSKEALSSLRVGLAFSFQVIDSIPTEPHDEKMDFIVTEDEIIECSRQKSS